MRNWISRMFAWLDALGITFYQHIAFGALVACLSALATCWLPMWATLIVSVLAVVAVAIGKEVYDDAIDWVDFGTTIGGGALVWIALIIW